jgi:UDP-glucose 4-epimerase
VDTLDSIKKITGKKPIFIQGDIRNKSDLATVFTSHTIDAVIHFAALKSVGESCSKP